MRERERERERERVCVCVCVSVCAALSRLKGNKLCGDTWGPGLRQYKMTQDAAILYRRVRAPVMGSAYGSNTSHISLVNFKTIYSEFMMWEIQKQMKGIYYVIATAASENISPIRCSGFFKGSFPEWSHAARRTNASSIPTPETWKDYISLKR